MMMVQTTKLYDQIEATLQQMPEADPTEEDSQPLAREEIAKLLLLVSRAHSIQQITVEQYRWAATDTTRT